MSGAYSQLLEATVVYLELLKQKGVRYVDVSPELVKTLVESASREGSIIKGNKQVQSQTVIQSSRADGPSVYDSPRLSSVDKSSAMDQLREEILSIEKSPEILASGANLVFGVGAIEADLMFIGEAPGVDEDREGEPFVGKAGQLLTKIIQATGLDRDKVYIANVLKYRPDTPGKSFGNRKPRPDEIESWFPFLKRQIEIIQPKVIVGLGATAIEGLLGHMPTGITRLRGNWQSYCSVPVMPTFHPSYLLRNQSWAVKRQVWEDMMQVMERLNMPISDKQRGFFLRK
ncbi:MAG: uracil-DNA glycosylase [Verrucomicrobiota bacterium]|nr:uracil-DNA glycosylase [Verrucomicrobiota bacterium]|tara:strand:- start:805 stop:1665 length:861 start_codon:yes stop_codon:yes gene_type:complete